MSVPQASLPWATIRTDRTALLVVHNTTTLNRLLDVVDVLVRDLRVQCLVTSDLSDPFAARLHEDVDALGFVAIPWEQATGMTFDLVVSASHHGRLEEVSGPLVLLTHGAGFGKFAPGEATGTRSVFGLSPQWVLHEGRPRAAALALPHVAQVETLARDAPAAVPAAVVVGDPCYDRLLASSDRRGAYRTALGIDDGSRLVLLTSTWGPGGLLGCRPDLVARLVDELPPDHRVALVAHPNIWAWHGAFQLRSWFADAVDSGLLVVPPLTGWQAALLAADAVVGDHGSVTVYGAALGRPTLLAAFPDADVVPGSAAQCLGTVAPRLRLDKPLVPQIECALAMPVPRSEPSVADLVTSAPGESAHRLGALFSRVLRLDPPLADSGPRPYPVIDHPAMSKAILRKVSFDS